MLQYTAYGISTLILIGTIIYLFKKDTSLESEYKKQLNEYSIKYDQYVLEINKEINKEGLNDEDKKYKINYYLEELLKLLIKLDSIDLTLVKESKKQELKLIRKGLIKKIQLKQKEIDNF